MLQYMLSISTLLSENPDSEYYTVCLNIEKRRVILSDKHSGPRKPGETEVQPAGKNVAWIGKSFARFKAKNSMRDIRFIIKMNTNPAQLP